VHGRLAVPRAQRGEVGDDAGLVVGGAAAVDPPVLERRRERVGVPAFGRRGLDVVVRVEQHRRPGPREVGEDRVRLARDRDTADLGGAGLVQQRLDDRGGLVQRLAGIALEGDRRDGDEPLQRAADQVGIDAKLRHGAPR
jgi:hypothetical protein